MSIMNSMFVSADWELPSQFDGFQAARAGLKNGHAPKLASAGTGGSYFIAGADGKPVAVFKPLDEEPCAVNNPKVRLVASSCKASCDEAFLWQLTVSQSVVRAGPAPKL